MALAEGRKKAFDDIMATGVPLVSDMFDAALHQGILQFGVPGKLYVLKQLTTAQRGMFSPTPQVKSPKVVFVSDGRRFIDQINQAVGVGTGNVDTINVIYTLSCGYGISTNRIFNFKSKIGSVPVYSFSSTGLTRKELKWVTLNCQFQENLYKFYRDKTAAETAE